MPDAARLRSAYLFGLAGFGLLSLGDAVIKSMAGAWPGPAVAALRFGIGAAGLGAILLWREGPRAFVPPRWGVQWLRGAALALASLMFFLAVFVMPLAEATAIQFVSPMLTALVSAWLIGERPARATLIASLVAFCGVLIVLRPNVELLGLAAFLPLGAAVGMAFVMTGNRMAAGDTSPLAAQFFVSIIAFLFLMLAATAGHMSGVDALHLDWPPASVMVRCAIVAVSASTAHALVYAATLRASSAAIAPTVYVQIVAATLIGIFWFGDLPDGVAMAGTAIIIASGLWLWYQTPGTHEKEQA
jgi:drug/metabolite transporter (DMT)-like permease